MRGNRGRTVPLELMIYTNNIWDCPGHKHLLYRNVRETDRNLQKNIGKTEPPAAQRKTSNRIASSSSNFANSCCTSTFLRQKDVNLKPIAASIFPGSFQKLSTQKAERARIVTVIFSKCTQTFTNTSNVNCHRMSI